MLNLDKTSNLGQKFATVNTILYLKLLPAIAGFIQVQQFLASLFTDHVKFDYMLFVKRMTPIIRASAVGFVLVCVDRALCLSDLPR